MESGTKGESQVRRFAGDGDNPPKQYKQWKRWARAYLKVQGSKGIRFPSVAKGYMVLRFAKLTPERKAVVLAAARRSYEEQDIMAALRTTCPEGLHQSRSSVNAVTEVEES